MVTERVTVGSVKIVSVSDGVMQAPPSVMFSGIPPELYAAALGDDLAADGTFAVKFGSFLVRSSGKTVLVDTGAGPKITGMAGASCSTTLRSSACGRRISTSS